MSKYRFSDAEKYAIYTVLGPKCIWCKTPVLYKDCEVDHIIPESYDVSKLDNVISHFKLSEKFNINSFYNWGPIHSACNKRKLAKTFKLAPFIGEILHGIEKKVPVIEKKCKHIEMLFSSTQSIAHLENALKLNKIPKEILEEIINKHAVINPSQIFKSLNCKTERKVEKGRYGIKKPRQLYNVSYEQFRSTNKNLLELNSIFKADAIRQLMDARENYFEYLKDYPTDDFGSGMDSNHEFSMNFSVVSKKFISYTTNVSFYHSGAAHGQYAISGKTFCLNPLRPFDLELTLKDSFGFFNKIMPLAYTKMLTDLQAREPELEISDYFPIEKEWLKPDFKTFNNYYFTEKALVFIFNPYEVSAFAYGAHFPEFPFDELVELFPEEDKLLAMISDIKKSASSPRN